MIRERPSTNYFTDFLLAICWFVLAPTMENCSTQYTTRRCLQNSTHTYQETNDALFLRMCLKSALT